MKVTVSRKEDMFQEGDLVCLQEDSTQVCLVTVPAKGYEDSDEGKFWAINLTGKRTSGGNYLKKLFVPFRGTITIEV